jgi:hypothetical protein
MATRIAARDLFGHPARRRRSASDAEARRQIAIVDYVRWTAPGILIWHVPNGGRRDKEEAAKLKRMGVLAGALDLTVALPEGRVAFWETKPPGEELSDEQLQVIERLSAMGHRCAVVWSIDDARRELQRLDVRTREALQTAG